MSPGSDEDPAEDAALAAPAAPAAPGARAATPDARAARKWDCLKNRAPGPRLPLALLALYALGAFEASLPDTAELQWLNTNGVSQAAQLRLFATAFAFFSLRPLRARRAGVSIRGGGRVEV